MRQPLCLISASELGETAVEVEESLEQVLELTSKWNAIFLLDECDRFLEARSTDDIRRNRLVSGEFWNCYHRYHRYYPAHANSSSVPEAARILPRHHVPH
jgi:hypothetical protein